MPKENLKDKLEGNELDLGLSNLTTVPVKELVSHSILCHQKESNVIIIAFFQLK